MTGRFQYQLFYSNKILLNAHPSFRFLTLADFTAYVTAQDLVSDTYTDQAKWAKMAIMNIARFKSVVGKATENTQLFCFSAGKFSSDRTIAEYAREIWGMEPR